MTDRLVRERFEVVDEDVAAILRTKSPAQRLRMVFDANQMVRKLIAGRVKTDHPDWTEDRIQREVARRMSGEAGRTAAKGD